MKQPFQRLLVIDNYDSFTFNLVHLLEQLDRDLDVKRNDALTLDDIEAYSHILIGPGPGRPENAGLVPEIISQFKSSKSILGVCLGMQALLTDAGVTMTNMTTVSHGAMDRIQVQGHSGLFRDLPHVLEVGRYHSWAFKETDIPEDFIVTAASEDGYVMAIEHSILPLSGVQFHPESIMTQHGLDMIRNWIY